MADIHTVGMEPCQPFWDETTDPGTMLGIQGTPGIPLSELGLTAAGPFMPALIPGACAKRMPLKVDVMPPP
jgi:hypothetical protein